MSDRTVTWETFEWRCGADLYRFEIGEGGIMGTLRGIGGQTMTLPMVAWEGLLDSLRMTRKARDRGAAPLPSRAGARPSACACSCPSCSRRRRAARARRRPRWPT